MDENRTRAKPISDRGIGLAPRRAATLARQRRTPQPGERATRCASRARQPAAGNSAASSAHRRPSSPPKRSRIRRRRPCRRSSRKCRACKLTTLYGGVNGAQDHASTCAALARSRPPIRWSSSTAAGSTTSIWPASISRPFRAIRSSASRSPEATAARCCTATTPSAASSTSSPRPASAARRSRCAAKPASARSTSAGVGFGCRQCRAVVNVVLRQRDQVRRISGQQRARSAQRRRRNPLHDARFHGLLEVVRRRSEAGIARRPDRRSLDRRRSNWSPTARGTDTPFDYANQQGANATAGFTKIAVERRRTHRRRRRAGQEAAEPASSAAYRLHADFNFQLRRHATLQTWSMTPRLSIKNPMFGLPSAILTGIDYYDATFHSESRPVQRRPAASHLRSVPADACRLLAADHRHACRPPISPMAAEFSNTSLTRARPVRSERARDFFDAAPDLAARQHRNAITRCMSASSTVSTTSLRCSAAPPAHSARPMSTSGSRRGPLSIRHLHGRHPRKLHAEDADL